MTGEENLRVVAEIAIAFAGTGITEATIWSACSFLLAFFKAMRDGTASNLIDARYHQLVAMS
jgi:hypothetical protein